MKKKIEDLSINELKYIIMHQNPDVDYSIPEFECAVCGVDVDVEFLYICDDCGKALDEHKDF